MRSVGLLLASMALLACGSTYAGVSIRICSSPASGTDRPVKLSAKLFNQSSEKVVESGLGKLNPNETLDITRDDFAGWNVSKLHIWIEGAAGNETMCLNQVTVNGVDFLNGIVPIVLNNDKVLELTGGNNHALLEKTTETTATEETGQTDTTEPTQPSTTKKWKGLTKRWWMIISAVCLIVCVLALTIIITTCLVKRNRPKDVPKRNMGLDSRTQDDTLFGVPSIGDFENPDQKAPDPQTPSVDASDMTLKKDQPPSVDASDMSALNKKDQPPTNPI